MNSPPTSTRSSVRMRCTRRLLSLASLRGTVTIARTTPEDAAISVVPANAAAWEDIAAIFGTRDMGQRCWCRRYKLAPRESFGGFPAGERATRLRRRTECAHPESETTSGLAPSLDPSLRRLVRAQAAAPLRPDAERE